MKTLHDYLVTVDPQQFADTFVERIDCAETHRDAIKECVFALLDDMNHIVLLESDNILFGYEQENLINARVASFIHEDLDDADSPVIEIHSEAISEFIYHTNRDSTLLWGLFLGMRVDMDGISEADVLTLLADVFDDMCWHDDDGEKWEDRAPHECLIEWLEWSRCDEAEKVARILTKYLTPGYEGEWRYSTEGISRHIWWDTRSQQ